MTQYLAIRSAASGPPLTGTNQGDVPLWDVATQKWYTGPPAGGGAVSSVFGRVGAVVAVTGDYDSDQVDNLSTVTGASVSDALDWLLANAGAVSSVFGRVGAVVATAGDYDSDQVDNVSTVTGATVSDALDALLAALVAVGPATTEGALLTDAPQTLDPSSGSVGQYKCLDATLTASRTKTIDPTNMGSQQSVVIVNGTQTSTMPIVNGGGAGGTVFTFPGDGLRRSASFARDVGTGQIVFGGWWFTGPIV